MITVRPGWIELDYCQTGLSPEAQVEVQLVGNAEQFTAGRRRTPPPEAVDGLPSDRPFRSCFHAGASIAAWLAAHCGRGRWLHGHATINSGAFRGKLAALRYYGLVSGRGE